MSMKIIINNQENLIIINKSKFIGIIRKIYNKEEAITILNEVKKNHPLATHICYAYILPNIHKYSDDNEPGGTAGQPILDVLKKNNLNNVIAIVVRYFGGIKLGSNGLIRAYSNTISSLLKDNIKDMETVIDCKFAETSKNKYIKLLEETIIPEGDSLDLDVIQEKREAQKNVLDYLGNNPDCKTFQN